jgi:hypothetical protein
MLYIYKKQDTRYFISQIRAPGGHDTTFIISTYTINKVKYNNYCITINHVCHRLEQREVNSSKIVLEFYIQFGTVPWCLLQIFQINWVSILHQAQVGINLHLVPSLAWCFLQMWHLYTFIIYYYFNKCGHRNVLSKRQVWMSIFHIINFKKKIHGHRGPGFF